jgi:hypothetical protein
MRGAASAEAAYTATAIKMRSITRLLTSKFHGTKELTAFISQSNIQGTVLILNLQSTRDERPPPVTRLPLLPKT